MVGKVTFEEKSHTYTNALGKKYISVTTLIGKYKPKKDWYKIATNYATKNGYTAEYWLAKWGHIKEAACEAGSEFHDGKEQELLDAKVDIHDGKKYDVDYEKEAEGVIDYSILGSGVYTELLLWSHKYGVAGKADKIIIDGNYVDVDDYKTNKEIDTESYYHPRYGFEYMLAPLDRVQNCTLNHYTLQLSLYAFLMEENGFTVRNLQFRWHKKIVDKDGNVLHIPDEPTQIFKIPYKRAAIIKLLNHHNGIK